MSNWIPVPNCTKVFAQPLPPDPNGNHRLLIKVEPGGAIPLHTHDCWSVMEIVAGEATPTGKSAARRTVIGESIFKSAGTLHGFTDISEEGFCFISISNAQGILQGDQWDFQLSV